MHNLAIRQYLDDWQVTPPNDVLSSRSYEQLAHVMSAHTGIRLPDAKKLMVEGRLRKRVRATGCADMESYCRYIFKENGMVTEFQHIVDAITTNKTDFFREPEHFDLLTKRAIPDLLEQHSGCSPVLKIWSAACSTGAEAYTIAMVLAGLASALRFKFAILGTDISAEVLEAARTAVYSEEMVRAIPLEMRRHYLLRSRQASEFRIVPELRRLAQFEHLNLMDHEYAVDHDVDVIFLRNVLIYFDKKTQHQVVKRLLGHLRPGGFLFLGHSESMIASQFGLREIGPATFQRR